ncbi:uncharacterized protein LTR77_000455 [Saxophila tyrrhenica]|uniref:C2H2-type domain-containing protein n=1 Tax=Saxophila tyrrhenica TaxID=1690608 RepID=A0AAV9PR73_9PEZI|nr:hypothetical protein LTR77_000455 [Saxophila tyrrhenica]
MGAPTSFTARRPNASSLPTFELPPPQLTNIHQKYQSYTGFNSQQPPTTLTSVGNLLTPPSNSSTDGISPGSSGVTSAGSQGALPPFTPTGHSGMWPPPNTGSNTYGFQSAAAPQPFGQGRGLFSPSLNSIMRGNNSPTATESLPPPPYDIHHYSGASMPMSAPSLPALQQHHQHQMMGSGMMGGQPPVTQASPVSAQEAYSRAPPTPTYYSQSAPSSAAPQQGAFAYPPGPSPVQQSPISAGGATQRSPVNGHGTMPSPQQQMYQRPYTYPPPGAVLSNVSNPGGHMQMVGGMPHHMVQGFNSGHAAQMQQMYQQQAPQNDRPFRCDQCPQSFNRNHDLKRHKRIHLAVKPFPCGHCDKSFSRKDALKRHILVKGCGKSHSTTEIKELDGSISPDTKSSTDTSPVVASA